MGAYYTNTWNKEIWTSKSSVFKCFQYTNGRYSDPHFTRNENILYLIFGGVWCHRLRLPNPGHIVNKEPQERVVSLVSCCGIRLAKTSWQDCRQNCWPLHDDGSYVQAQVRVVGEGLGQVVGQKLDVQAGMKLILKKNKYKTRLVKSIDVTEWWWNGQRPLACLSCCPPFESG